VDLVIDPETISIDFKIVDLLVYAILIKKHSASRAVRVFSNLIRNIVIGLNKGASFIIVIIGPSKTYRLFSSPSIRYFRRYSS
jgi:hypothetical protein